jgi:hypothetical protein
MVDPASLSFPVPYKARSSFAGGVKAYVLFRGEIQKDAAPAAYDRPIKRLAAFDSLQARPR